MNEDLNIIIWLLLIAALIISIIFASASIYDYTVRQELHETTRNNNITQNCIPYKNYRDSAIELITNKTHSFQPQTCIWIKIQESSQIMDDKFWNELWK